MKRAVLLTTTLAIALLLGTGVAVLSPNSASLAATPLYPNLKTLTPDDLHFDQGTISGSTHNLLRFSNAVGNVGEGRLELAAKTVSTTSGKKTRVNQRIYDSPEGYTSRYVGDMVFHEQHDHFHFENFARYELWTRSGYDNWVASNRAQGQAIKRGTKTTFCVMDTDLIQGNSSRSYTTCTPEKQGLSVGWADTYKSHLYGQWIDLGTSPLPDGQYVLRSVADPNNRLYESAKRGDSSRESAQDNEAVKFFKVAQGGTVIIE